MLDRWLASGLPRERVRIVNASGVAPRPGLATTTHAGGDAPDVLVLAVKPHQLDVAAGTHAALARPPRVVLSILAGVDLATLAARLPGSAVVRALPNLPVALGQGVTLLHGDPAAHAVARTLAEPLGLDEWIADETLFDAATALAGSGPGFVFRIIDALAQGGVALGLPAEQAARLALATVAGSAALAAGAAVAPAELAAQVASKGGSTQAGYDVLDAGNALNDLFARTLAAAERRNVAMGAEARGGGAATG